MNLGLTEEQLVSLLLSNPYLKQANLLDYFLSAAKFLTDKNPMVSYYIGGSAVPFLSTFLLDHQNSEGFVNHLANMGGALYSAEKQGISYSWSYYTNNYFNNLNVSSEAARKRINNGSTVTSSLIKLAEDKATAIKADIAQHTAQAPVAAPVIPTTSQPTPSTSQSLIDLAALEQHIADLIAKQHTLTLTAQALDVEITELTKTLSTSQLDLNKLIAYNSNVNAFQGGVSIPAGAQLFFSVKDGSASGGTSPSGFNGYNKNTVFGVFADGSYTAYSSMAELNKDMALSNTKTISTLTAQDAQNRINQYKTQYNQLVEVQKQKDAAEQAKNKTEIDRLNALITSINLTLQQKQQESANVHLQVTAAGSEVTSAQQKRTFVAATPKNSTVKTDTITSSTKRQDLVNQGYIEAFVYDIATGKSSFKYEKLSVIVLSTPTPALSMPNLTATVTSTPQSIVNPAVLPNLEKPLDSSELTAFKGLVSAFIDFIPLAGDAKGALEAMIGKDLVTFQDLDNVSRGLSAAGAIPFIGWSADATKLGKRIQELLKLISKGEKPVQEIKAIIQEANKLTQLAKDTAKISKQTPAQVRAEVGETIWKEAQRVVSDHAYYEHLDWEKSWGNIIRTESELTAYTATVIKNPSDYAEIIRANGERVKLYWDDRLGSIIIDKGSSTGSTVFRVTNTRFPGKQYFYEQLSGEGVRRIK